MASRVLGLRTSTESPELDTAASAASEIASREMLWSAFIELVVFTAPMLNWRWFRTKVTGCLKLSSEVKAAHEATDFACAACAADPPVIPSRAGCDHVFCHYCAAVAAGERSACPRCGVTLETELLVSCLGRASAPSL